MKKLLVVLLATFLPFTAGEAQMGSADTLASEIGFYSQRFRTRDSLGKDSLAIRFSLEAYRYLTRKQGLYMFAWYEPRVDRHKQVEYLSGSFAYFYDFTKTFEVAVVVGGEIEVDREAQENVINERYGAFVVLGPEWLFLDAYLELGPSGPWHQVFVNLQLAEWLTVGPIAQTDDGVGARLRLTIPKTSLRVWAAPMADLDIRGHRLDWGKGKLLLGAEVIYRTERIVRKR